MTSLRYPVVFDNDCLASFLWVPNIITAYEGEQIWQEMKNKKRLLPDYDFQEVIRRQQEGLHR
ncbi:MAG: hypothetical protein AB1327_11875 [Bacillota bacterium]|uniref:hypothetical protein n=1 Tax=unclassified Candidatus Desulforudis TaxID=2635950 RepID=UPI00347BFB16